MISRNFFQCFSMDFYRTSSCLQEFLQELFMSCFLEFIQGFFESFFMFLCFSCNFFKTILITKGVATGISPKIPPGICVISLMIYPGISKGVSPRIFRRCGLKFLSKILPRFLQVFLTGIIHVISP